MSDFDRQFQKIKTENGFIAALDQSGGSTPKALQLYGIDGGAWSNDDEMFAVIHRMRSRMVTSPAFRGDRVFGAILFENTIDREIEGRPSADYLWNVKRIVPFLKVDKGLAEEAGGVRLMKPMPDLDGLLARAKAKRIFGTKMRSVIARADAEGVEAVVRQQFEIGRRIAAAGFIPIIEPEVDIRCPEKAAAERLLKAALAAELDRLESGQTVMFKLTLPEQDGLYADFVKHDRVLKVVALSGGYSREEANRRLARNPGVAASFSRALAEGLSAGQSADEFNAALERAIAEIYAASIT